MSKARRGDRSFQPSSAGKGSGDRTIDQEAYNKGLEEVAWPRKSYGTEKKTGFGRVRITYGKTPVTPTAPTEVKHITEEAPPHNVWHRDDDDGYGS